MVLKKICPYCKNTTLLMDNMNDAYCIMCGRMITSENATPMGALENTEEKTYIVTFYYQRGFLSEFDRGCIIIVDNQLESVASENSETEFKLPPGKHHIILKAHVDAGVNSTDVITSDKINVNSDQSYVIKASGGIHRKLTMTQS